MEYEEMLKRAIEKIPKKIEIKERFEIPQINCEISGNKSILKNFGEILTTIRRNANHLAKFLFKELATAGSIQGNVLVFQGKISREVLQKKLEEYIKEFVYCRECGKPDTKLIKEERTSFLKCEACGCRYPVRKI